MRTSRIDYKSYKWLAEKSEKGKKNKWRKNTGKEKTRRDINIQAEKLKGKRRCEKKEKTSRTASELRDVHIYSMEAEKNTLNSSCYLNISTLYATILRFSIKTPSQTNVSPNRNTILKRDEKQNDPRHQGKTFVLTTSLTFSARNVRMRRMHITLFDSIEKSKRCL